MNKKSNASVVSINNEETYESPVTSHNEHDLQYLGEQDSIPDELNAFSEVLKTLVMNRLEDSDSEEAQFHFELPLSDEEVSMVSDLLENTSKQTFSKAKETVTPLLSKSLEMEFGSEVVNEALSDGWLNILANHCFALVEGEKLQMETINNEPLSSHTGTRKRKRRDFVDFSNTYKKESSKEVKPLRNAPSSPRSMKPKTGENSPISRNPRGRAPMNGRPRPAMSQRQSPPGQRNRRFEENSYPSYGPSKPVRRTKHSSMSNNGPQGGGRPSSQRPRSYRSDSSNSRYGDSNYSNRKPSYPRTERRPSSSPSGMAQSSTNKRPPSPASPNRNRSNQYYSDGAPMQRRSAPPSRSRNTMSSTKPTTRQRPSSPRTTRSAYTRRGR